MIAWDRVEELKRDIGGDDFAEIVVLFLEETDETVQRLTGAGTDGAVAEELHSLKGSALNLGFRELGELCHQGERQARNGNSRDVDIAGVIDSYRRSRQTFLDVLEAEAAPSN